MHGHIVKYPRGPAPSTAIWAAHPSKRTHHTGLHCIAGWPPPPALLTFAALCSCLFCSDHLDWLLKIDVQWGDFDQVPARICRLVAPALMAASVALQLPPGRRPSGPNWPAVAALCKALDSVALAHALEEYSGSLQLVRAAVRLLHLTADSSAELAHGKCVLMCTQLASILNRGMVACEQRPSECRQAFNQLWAALAALQHQLQQLLEPGSCSAEQSVHALWLWDLLVSRLSMQCLEQLQVTLKERLAGSHSSLDLNEHLKCLKEAAAALRALPALAAIRQQQQQQPAECVPDNDSTRHCVVANRLLHLCCAASSLLASSAEQLPSAGSDAAASLVWQAHSTAAASLVWQAHSTACRAAHWLVAEPSRRCLLLSSQELKHLAAALENCMKAAVLLAGSGHTAMQPNAVRSQLHAMSMAHSSALQALLSCTDVTIDSSASLQDLATAYAAGPSALVLQPEASSLFNCLLDKALQVGCRIGAHA